MIYRFNLNAILAIIYNANCFITFLIYTLWEKHKIFKYLLLEYITICWFGGASLQTIESSMKFNDLISNNFEISRPIYTDASSVYAQY